MISSNSNPRVKEIAGLNTSSKLRREKKLFVTEGEKMFIEAPKELIEEVYVTEDYLKDCPLEAKKKLEEKGFETVSEGVFNKMSDTKTPQGVLCVLRQEDKREEEILEGIGEEARILLLEGIQDPGNLGTMIRSCEGAGFELVIADNKTADLYNPKVVRATMGSIFRVKVLYCEELLKMIDKLKEKEVRVYAAHLKGEISYRDEDYGKKTAFLIGNEGKGLSPEATARADKLLKIPMKGRVESLNAAVAAAILMYNL
ncbi:MAG: RNA methyltransferase [Lachnospiraceae bacterium]|nr:RNA methyltransferase [Lachnospiraceae bacterium]